MFDVRKSIKTYAAGRKLDVVSGVILHAGQDKQGNEIVYTSGDDTGYVLEVTNETGTQEDADAILANLSLRGLQYQAYNASGVKLDPTAEIGDTIKIDTTVSVINSLSTRHGRLMFSEVSNPLEEEIDHAFKFEPRSQREFKRVTSRTLARLTIAEDSIEAKVSRESPEGQESFSWKLLSDSHTWYSNDTMVMRVDRRGLRIEGEIYATSGRIGDAEIVNGVLTINGANIRNLNADYITVGTLNVERLADGSITGGSGGKIASGTVTTHNTVSGINTNLGYAANWAAAKTGYGNATDIYAEHFHSSGLSYFIGVSTYYLIDYPTGNRYDTISFTLNGVTYHVFGYTS